MLLLSNQLQQAEPLNRGKSILFPLFPSPFKGEGKGEGETPISTPHPHPLP